MLRSTPPKKPNSKNTKTSSIKNESPPDFLFAYANRIIASDPSTRNRPFQRLESLPRWMRPSLEANPLDSESVPALLRGLFLSVLLDIDLPKP